MREHGNASDSLLRRMSEIHFSESFAPFLGFTDTFGLIESNVLIQTLAKNPDCCQTPSDRCLKSALFRLINKQGAPD